jgi:hypothetical protein
MADSQPQQAGRGQQPQQPLRADDILKLQSFTDDEKQKYRQVMLNFWNMTQQYAQGTSEHTTARQKLNEYSQKFIFRERQYRAKMKQQQQQQGNPGQSSQGPQPAQPAQNPVKQEQPQALQRTAEGVTAPQQPQAPQQPPPVQQMPQNPAAPGQPRPATSQIDPSIIKHVQDFPIQLPPNGPAPGTPEYGVKLKEYRNGYLNMLAKQAGLAENRRQIQIRCDERIKAGQTEMPPDLYNMRARIEKEYIGLNEQLDKFRRLQKQWKDEREQKMGQQAQAQPGQSQQAQLPTPSPQQQQQQQPQRRPSQLNIPGQPPVKEEPQIKVEGGQVPQPQPVAQFNQQGNPQQLQQQQQQQQQQQPQNLQMPLSLPQQSQQVRPPPAPHSQTMPGQTQQYAHPGQHQNRPQINPHQANPQMHQNSNSPLPQSATTAGPPVPLSHQAAVSAANRSYTDPQRTMTPMQAGGQSNFGSREREQLNNPKMPIPRHLNVTAPAPVHMGQSRPTMSGPTNGAPGPMGQPAIPRPPPFQLEGEGDRVLSKRKLDELVRQVTGGSEEALTPEVEEVRHLFSPSKFLILMVWQSVLQLADDFVDNVISNACKLSKLRESPQLDIRDIQLVLERNYNIRIPGYASDEVRTVRKIVPAAGWVDKMKAVNAAKVMGGKADF